MSKSKQAILDAIATKGKAVFGSDESVRMAKAAIALEKEGLIRTERTFCWEDVRQKGGGYARRRTTTFVCLPLDG